MTSDLMRRTLKAAHLSMNVRMAIVLFLSLLVCSSMFGSASAIVGDNENGTTAQPEKPQAPADGATSEADEPDAEALYDRFIEAIGGKKAVSDIETAHTKTTLLAGSQQLVLETNWHRDGAFTFEYTNAGVTNRAGSDGVIGWMYNSQGGYRLISSEMLPKVYDNSTYTTMLLTLPKRYEKMRLIGRDTFHDRPAYRVELTDHKGDTRLAFYDRETNLILGLRWTEPAPIGDLTVEMLFENWKEYGKIRSWSRLVITKLNTVQTVDIDVLEFNNVEPSTFMLPEAVKDLVAKQVTEDPTQPKRTAPPSKPAKPSQPSKP